MKKFFLVGVLILLVNSFCCYAILSCNNKAACSGDEVKVLGMYETTNSHAAVSGYPTDYSVCCSGVSGLSTDVSGITFLKLSYVQDSHVEKNSLSNYINNAKISADGDIACAYESSCADDTTCLVSFSSETNAHVGDCDAYSTKVCCKCTTTVSGYVRDEDTDPVDNAKIEVMDDNEVLAYDYSQNDGSYSVDIPCGTFNIKVSAENFISGIKNDIVTPADDINFVLTSGLSCESDCTYAQDNTIHSECEGIDGCRFYDATAKQACNLAQPGWEVDYDEDKIVECPNGPVRERSTMQASGADAKCPKENLVKYSRIVNYKGKPVKIVTVICGD